MNPEFSDAVEVLRQSLDTMVNNAPINRAKGKHDQAELEDRTAASIRAALAHLGA